MRKLIGIFLVLLFTSSVYAMDVTVSIPDSLYPYLVKTVDNINNEEIAKDSNYTLQTVPSYLSKILVPVVSSYKNKIEEDILKNEQLRQAALKLTNLPPKAQTACLQYLEQKVQENK